MSVTIECLWKDRKRYFGLPLSFTRYALSEDRLFISVGFLNIKDDEILLYRVRDIDTSRSLWQRIFGVGTLTLYSADQSCPQLLLKNIKRPEKLHRYLSDVIEKNRQSKGIAGREIVGMAAMRPGPVPDHDHPEDLPNDLPEPPEDCGCHEEQ